MGFILLIIGMIVVCYLLAQISKKMSARDTLPTLITIDKDLCTDLEAKIEISAQSTVKAMDLPDDFPRRYLSTELVVFTHYLLLQDILTQTETSFLQKIADYHKGVIIYLFKTRYNADPQKAEHIFNQSLAIYLNLSDQNFFIPVDILHAIKKFKSLILSITKESYSDSEFDFDELNIELSNKLFLWAQDDYPEIKAIHNRIITSPVPVSRG